jgi:large subunit ribosomal protein L13
MMKTYSAKPTDVTREWYVLDADGQTLGRLATQIASLLTGKGKPIFTKHIDCGDFVIVINTAKLSYTGKKLDDKMYYHHSHFPGGLKEATLSEKILKDPSAPLYTAVRGMLPVNKLRDERLKRLKLYTNEEHNHAAQKPKTINLKEAK